MKASMSSNFSQIPPPTLELSALARLKNFCINVVNTIAPSFLIDSSSFLQVTRTSIKSCKSSKFDQIRPWDAESPALERYQIKSLLHQGLSEPEFYGDLVYKFKKIRGMNDFSDQFRKKK